MCLSESHCPGTKPKRETFSISNSRCLVSSERVTERIRRAVYVWKGICQLDDATPDKTRYSRPKPRLQAELLCQPIISIAQRLRIIEFVPGVVPQNFLGFARGIDVVLLRSPVEVVLEVRKLQKQRDRRRVPHKSKRVELTGDLHIFFELSSRLALAQLYQAGIVTAQHDVRGLRHSRHQHRGFHALVHRRENASPLRAIAVTYISEPLCIHITARQQ